MRLPRPRAKIVVLTLFGILVLLGLLAIPFRTAPDDAQAAKTELQAARDALGEGDMETASDRIEKAREHADDLQGSVQGIGGHVWSWVPLAGGPVRDVRRLGNALDDLVTVAETGVELWPQVSGDEATLYNEGDVDLPTLATLTDEADGVIERLVHAREELEDIPDSRLLAGGMLATPRDEALDQVVPLADGAEALGPVMDHLPDVLGDGSDRRYVLAMLNPAEMLYSGGTPQSYSTVDFSNGQLEMGETMDLATSPEFAEQRKWKKVSGNPFHTGKLRLATSTMAPDWSVSGNELTNAWRSVRGRQVDGVIAIDVVALSDLVALTGPVEVPGLGRLTKDTMVKQLIGSYDAYPDMEERKEINRALGDIFAERLFAGDPVDTLKALAKAARERRFALFFTRDQEQDAFTDLGLSGDLGSPEGDYLGVFTQNRVPSKSDYWQRRAVTSDVVLAEDGSAKVTLEIKVHNDSPPYLQPYPDPGISYFTRHNNLRVAAFLPPDITLHSASLDGKKLGDKKRQRYFKRTFVRQIVEFLPRQSRTLKLTYDVPKAAEVTDDGLVYRLAIDPQGMVNPQAVAVNVTFPEGHEVGQLPEGWTRGAGGTAVFDTPALLERQSFEIPAAS